MRLKSGLKYRVSHLLVDQGWVDLAFECSTVCPILQGLMGIWQKRLGRWPRWFNIQIKVKPTQDHEWVGHPVYTEDTSVALIPYIAGRPICLKILLCFSMKVARACLGSK